MINIILCVFGYKDYIESTIRSLLCQNFQSFELIIIDDGCDYDLNSLINSINDKRIKYYRNEKNIGFTASLIKGVNFSKNRYIAIHDAGNIAYPEKIELQYNYLEHNKNIFLVGTSVELIDENDQIICNIIANSNGDYIKKNLPFRNLFKHSSIMFRNDSNFNYRSKFKYAQDCDFYLNLLSKGKKLTNFKEVLLKERFLKNSISFAKKTEQDFYANIARKFYYERKNFGFDSYDVFEPEKEVSKSITFPSLNEYIYKIQKIHFLLFSMKLKDARSLIKEILKEKWNSKLLILFTISYFPFIVKFISKLKKLDYS